MDTQTILKYVMNNPENTNPNVLKGMLDELSEGGGSSDFSTATVKITADRTSGTGMGAPFVKGALLIKGDDETEDMTNSELMIQNMSIDVIMAKGGAFLSFVNSSNTTISSIDATGEVEEYGEYTYLILGDSTFTVHYVGRQK